MTFLMEDDMTPPELEAAAAEQRALRRKRLAAQRVDGLRAAIARRRRELAVLETDLARHRN